MANRPNILFILTDQQRWDTTGVHGNPLELTPNFDRMAREGTHLYNTFTCQPVCAPARACLQTGLYATANGVWRNGLNLGGRVPTLADHFRASGYATGYIGKWHLGDPAGEGAVPEALRGGYEYWLASNALEMTSDAYRTTMYDNENQSVSLPGYRVDALTDAAIRFIDRRQAEPFFLFLSFLEPHFQNRRDHYPAPSGYEERYTGRWLPPDLAALGGTSHQHIGGYYGMVKRLDEALGRLLDALRSLNLLENTIVVFTTDHGNHFKTRNGEYKRSCHESSIRIPCAITGPGFDSGGQIRRLASLLDLPPTLLDAAGLPVPAEMQGRSLLPLVNRRAAEWEDEILIQISESQVGRAIRTPRWKYSVSAPGLNGGEQAGAQRYQEEYLYDLDADPYEMVNLIGLESHRALADRLAARLGRLMVQAGEPAPLIDPAPPRTGNPQRFLFPEELP
jgi:arylsulfatase A-like enzyme